MTDSSDTSQWRHHGTQVTEHDFDLGVHGAGTVWIIRDDLIHPFVSGNKLRKLRYQDGFNDAGPKHIVTLGGPWSNHLIAVGYWVYEMGWRATFFIRGRQHHSNPVLDLLDAWGIERRHLDRALFDEYVEHPDEIRARMVEENQVLWPAGGDNQAGVRGCVQIPLGVKNERLGGMSWVMAAGYGTTALGIIEGRRMAGHTGDHVVISAIPSASALKELQLRLPPGSLCLSSEHGAFGQIDQEGIELLVAFFEQTGVLLDPLYNGKALLTYLKHRTDQDPFVLYHSGGVLGWHGVAHRHARMGTDLNYLTKVRQILPSLDWEKSKIK